MYSSWLYYLDKMKQDNYSKPRMLDGVAKTRRPRITPPTLPANKYVQPPVFPVAKSAQAPVKKTRFSKFKKLLPSNKKQAAVFAGCALVLIGGAVVARLILTSCKVLACGKGNSALALQDDVDPTKLKGEGDGRVNVLLMGVGDASHQAADLTDTIQIASLDPISKNVTLFSIPRDLYLKIPGYGSDRINAAHVYGERDGLPGGGPELLKQTISQNLGIPIHYFARLDFSGFSTAVEAVGGVEVNVDETIHDYSYPDEATNGYSTFYIQAGRRFLDGTTALKYVRSRYTTSDFDRSKRQQKVMIALKEKALSLGTLTNPVKINSLLASVGNDLKTDLNVKEMIKLIKMGKEITEQKITRAGLDNNPDNYLASTNVGGASVMVPKAGDFSEIKKYVRSLMPDGYIKKEDGNVDVYNGTEESGLATATADLLKTYGYKIRTVGDAPNKDNQKTIIYDYSNGAKPYTLRYLEKRFGVKAQRKTAKPNEAHADIVITLGRDYKLTE